MRSAGRGAVGAATLAVLIAFVAGAFSAHRQLWVYRQAIEIKRSLFSGGAVSGPLEAELYDRRVSLFATLNGSADVVMVGDSLTAYSEWPELLGGVRVHNRGIGSDTVKGLAGRLAQICGLRYSMAFLMIGINDALAGSPIDQFEKLYGQIVERLKSCSGTVVVQLLIQPDRTEMEKVKVAAFNERILKLAAKFGVKVLDLNPMLAPSGRLGSRFSNDGLHLNGAGYAIWSSEVRALIGKNR